MRAAILTLSDKGARGERIDESGPALSAWLAERGVQTVQSRIIADEFEQIVAVLTEWADADAADLILLVVDGSLPYDSLDEKLIPRRDDHPLIVVINKIHM